MDRRAGALPILFMLAAETEAARPSVLLSLVKQKSIAEWTMDPFDALGDFRFVFALTKLSSKRAENPIYHGPDHSVVTG